MFCKISFLSLLLSYIVYMESEASYIPFFGEPPSSNGITNSENRAKAANINHKTIVVEGGGGGFNYPPPCDNGGAFGLATSFFVGSPCTYG